MDDPFSQKQITIDNSVTVRLQLIQQLEQLLVSFLSLQIILQISNT